jgi:hypothetical protein
MAISMARFGGFLPPASKLDSVFVALRHRFDCPFSG